VRRPHAPLAFAQSCILTPCVVSAGTPRQKRVGGNVHLALNALPGRLCLRHPKCAPLSCTPPHCDPSSAPQSSAWCRYIKQVPKMWEAHCKRHWEVGYSGLLGGFEEEKQVLWDAAGEVMPEDHRMRGNLNAMLERISTNAQWPWHYKMRAAQQVARTLLQADEVV
jgi:hypothetical protein